MSIEFKLSLASNVAGSNYSTVYTCPAGKTAVIKIVNLVDSTGVTSSGHSSALLAIKRGGNILKLSNSVDLAANSSVNAIVGTMNLEANDSVLVSRPITNVWYPTITNGIPFNSPRLILSSGDTYIVAQMNSFGIQFWRSADAGKTFNSIDVSVPSNFNTSGGEITGAVIGSSYFVYHGVNRSLALRSTDDGLTWQQIAVTNAPGYQNNRTYNHIKYNGSVFVGAVPISQADGFAQLVSSTDGITWTAFANLPAACGNFDWTGTHWVAGRIFTLAEVYRSTDGATWQTVAVSGITAGGVSSANLCRLVSNGAGTVFYGNNTSGSFRVSSNHGASFATSFSGLTGINGQLAFAAGHFWVVPTINSPNSHTITKTGLAGSSLIGNVRPVIFFSNPQVFEVSNGDYIYPTGTRLARFNEDSITNNNAGMDCAISILEVTP